MNEVEPMKALLILLTALFLCGCSGSPDDGMADNAEQAAAQIEQAFAGTEGFAHEAARAASEAMRQGDFEKAVVSLQTVKASTNITVDQGLAIHSSAVALEAELLAAMAAGDQRAAQAYELLKAMKRD